jgi:hypothetical protein
MKTVTLISLLPIGVPSASKQKKVVGEIRDTTSLAKIGSYCVDVSNLSGAEAYNVTSFVAVEGHPAHVLSKLPWKLLPDCRDSGPDAVIKLEFPRLRVINVTTGPPPGTAMPDDQTHEIFHIVAILRVLDAGSSHLL